MWNNVAEIRLRFDGRYTRVNLALKKTKQFRWDTLYLHNIEYNT